MSNPAMMSNPAESTRTLVIERVFPHPPEKLWRALTENPLIAQWLLKNDFEPVVGRKFQFRSEPVPNWDGVIDCEVLIVDHLKRLSYSWSSLGLESVVLWTLTPARAAPTFAWSSPASVPISRQLIKVQNTAGSTSSTVWSGCSAGV
jgi:uncharacterized protein YndB with AHSA1/START domain